MQYSQTRLKSVRTLAKYRCLEFGTDKVNNCGVDRDILCCEEARAYLTRLLRLLLVVALLLLLVFYSDA